MKLLASHLGGTRNPMVVRWPTAITPDPVPRAQFHHCNDVVPTIYEILGISSPREVNGIFQDPIDGVSFAYSLNDPEAEGRLKTQYFEIMASRGIYHDGWMASTIGPRLPWVKGVPPGIFEWTPDNDVWELYHLDQDWSQSSDLAAKLPEKLAQMKDLFWIEAARNDVLPIGGGLWTVVFHPELRIQVPQTEWEFAAPITRIPEFCAPALGNKNNLVTIEAAVGENANGVLYKLGGAGGGLTCFAEDGVLCYEYNLFIIQRTKIRSSTPLPAGHCLIEIQTTYAEPRPGGPLDVTMRVNGEQVGHGQVPISAPLLFSANECLDIGTCLGSPVSMDYYHKAPFSFDGTIKRMHVAYLPAGNAT
jgi:arylsulfatase